MRNDLVEQAQAIRAGMQALARTAPDAVLLAQPMAMYDEWSAEGVEYALDDIRQYNGLLYRCVQAHTSQATWTPEDAPSPVDAHRGPGAGVAGVDPADRARTTRTRRAQRSRTPASIGFPTWPTTSGSRASTAGRSRLRSKSKGAIL